MERTELNEVGKITVKREIFISSLIFYYHFLVPISRVIKSERFVYF